MWQGGDPPLEQVGQKKPGGEKREEGRRSEKIQLLSRISGYQIVCFRRSKRKSSSTRRELRVDTRIRGFRQTPRGRGSSHTRFYSWSKSHSNGIRFGVENGCAVQFQKFGTGR